ncbi:MAG: DUF2259 domain-containing protein [Spirochaetes bacterium]|nr:DUF2259 domain-containing protein [Spirochaetota bacterium]
MRKISVLLIIFIILGSKSLFAGDIANFVNIGFSGNSRYFMFAQYGVTATETYSEIFAVDVINNRFVPNGVIRKRFPVRAHSMDNGSGAFFKSLLAANQIIQRINIDPLAKGRSIFVNIDKGPTHSVQFRDFQTGKTYNINLHERSEIRAGVYESTFHLNILVTRDGLPSRAYTAGSPNFVRRGVKGYSIRKVFLSPDERNLVVVVERREVHNNSVSIRYMVETLPL